MSRCPGCRYELPVQLVSSESCPRCGIVFAALVKTPKWISIARLANLAEVGYYADQIEARHIHTNVIQHNDFNALDGSWQTIFVLQVPEEHAASTTEWLQSEIARCEEDASEWDQNSITDEDCNLTTASVWKPLALVLVASGLAYCAGRGGMDQPPVAPSRQTLWHTLSRSKGVMINESPLDKPRRRLWFDAPSRMMVLEEDIDGDGRFDRQRRFRDGHLVREFALDR